MPLPIAWPRWRAVRNVDAGRYLEGFLVAAVAAVLVIRFFLELTGYPQLGGHGLHIAHMLWGGLLMLAALVLMLAFLGKHVQHLAAIVAGIGFGTFIDELGKFITSDNDYFFQPTMALIYATFVLLFLAFRAIEPRELLSEQERLVNAIDLLKEAIIAGDAGAQRERALDLLGPSAGASPLVPVLRAAIERAPLAAPAPTRTRDVHLGFATRSSPSSCYTRSVRWRVWPH